MYSVWYQTTIAFFYYSLLPTHIHTHSCKHRHAVLERVLSTRSLVIYIASKHLEFFFFFHFIFSYFFFFSVIHILQPTWQLRLKLLGILMLLLYINLKTKNKGEYGTQHVVTHNKCPWWFVVMAYHTLFLPLVLTLVLSLSCSCHLFSPYVDPVSVSTVWLQRYLFLDIVFVLQGEAEIKTETIQDYVSAQYCYSF